jgi:hypothetical protein
MRKLLTIAFFCTIFFIAHSSVINADVVSYGVNFYTTPSGWSVIASVDSMELVHGFNWGLVISDLSSTPATSINALNIAFHNISNDTNDINQLNVYFRDDIDSPLGLQALVMHHMIP